ANDPELLLLDEPFSALDALTKMELQDELIELMDNLDLTAVFVTHDVEEAVYVGDRVAVMGSGGDGVRAEVDVADVDSRDDEDFPGAKHRLLGLLDGEVDL
ncbi:MAG: ABC transporter ATP-binding protein, partial [Halobacteriales archaeon]